MSTPEKEIYIGTPQDDYFISGPTSYKIKSGAGNDIIIASYGDDEIFTDDGDDFIDGGQGNNIIYSGQGDDYIYCGHGNNFINDMEGTNFIFTGDGNNQIHAGGIKNIIATGTGNDFIKIYSGQNDITLTGGNNIIISYGSKNQIKTGFGNDAIYTLGQSDDTISSGSGNDYIYNVYGTDTIHAGAGNDTVITNFSQDTVNDGAGNDQITLNEGDDTVIYELITNQTYHDIFDAGIGYDKLTIKVSNEIAQLQWFKIAIENYQLFLAEEIQVKLNLSYFDPEYTNLQIIVNGFEEVTVDIINPPNISTTNLTVNNNASSVSTADIIYEEFHGTTASDYFFGHNGTNYKIFGEGGFDSFITGDGNDIVYASGSINTRAGDDEIYGFDLDDEIESGSGNDKIFSAGGNDYIYSISGNDWIESGDGNDTIRDLSGNNYIDAGNGDDRVYVLDGINTVLGGAGNDQLFIYSSNSQINGGEGNDIIRIYNQNNRITDLFGNNIIELGNNSSTVKLGSGNDKVSAGDGRNIISIQGGNNEVTLGNGHNTIIAYGGQNQIKVGNGHDFVIIANKEINSTEIQVNYIETNEGNDIIIANSGNNTVIAGKGNDQVFLGIGNDMVFYNADLNKGYNDIYDAGDGDDILIVDAFAQIAKLDWFQTAMSDYETFLANGNLTEFDFGHYDPNSEHLQLVVKNFEYISINVTGDLTNNFAPSSIELTQSTFAETTNHINPITSVSSLNDENEIPTYRLVNNAGGRFTIDSTTGDIYLSPNYNPDFENEQHEFSITIEVTDNNGHFVQKDFTISMTDVNETPSDIHFTNNKVVENFNATEITQVTSTNDLNEQPSYTILEDLSGLFSIDENTGVVSVKPGTQFDYETAHSFDLTIEVNDNNGFKTIKTLTLNIEDINENPELILSHTNPLFEHSKNGLFVTQVSSSSDPEQEHLYKIVNDAIGLFTIDEKTGVVKVANSELLDFELAPQVDLTIEATDETGLSTQETFIIDLLNVAEVEGVEIAPSYEGLLNGHGQTVAVIDSGLTDYLDVFSNKTRDVMTWNSATKTNSARDSSDFEFHGTSVASVIAAKDDALGGWAPEVDLVGIKVLVSGAPSFEEVLSFVESALRWVIDHHNTLTDPITTINMSLGYNGSSLGVPSWSTFEDELAELEELGVFMSVAAGNAYQSEPNFGLDYPAMSPHVVPVASHNIENEMSYFSQRNPSVLTALGQDVELISPVLEFFSDEHKTIVASGTSISAPQVAGAALLMREYLEVTTGHKVNQAEIYDVFYNHSDIIHDDFSGVDYHKLNFEKAFKAITPNDYYGDDASTALKLGDIFDTDSWSGFIEAELTFDESTNGKPLEITGYDQDYFTFTATETSTIYLTATANGLSAINVTWLTDNISSVEINNHILAIDVIANENYTVGITSSSGYGYYEINAQYTFAPENAPVYSAKFPTHFPEISENSDAPKINSLSETENTNIAEIIALPIIDDIVPLNPDLSMMI